MTANGLQLVVAGLWEILQVQDRHPQLPKRADRAGNGAARQPWEAGKQPWEEGVPSDILSVSPG